MKKISNKRFRGLYGACFCTLTLVSIDAYAAGNNTANLQANIQIGAPTECGIQVTPPSGDNNVMNARWDRGEQNGTLTVISSGLPTVTVMSTGGQFCSLNTLALTTDAGNATPVSDNEYALRKQFQNANLKTAYWRFIPYLAQAKFYTSVDQSSGEAGKGVILFDDPDPQHPATGDLSFSNTPSYNAGQIINTLPDGRDYTFLTDSFVDQYGAALLVYGDNKTGHFSSTDSSALYQSARLGFGVLLANDPEGDDGKADPNQSPADGGQVNIMWTVIFSVS